MIVPYITKNLWPNIMWPPIQSHGDWGQSQFQLGGDDESTHQLLSYGLLFLTFYHFPYTADPLTCTMLMQPPMTFVQTFMQSPSTIPYTHCTISPVPLWRPPIWPTDHIVIFSFLSLFFCYPMHSVMARPITSHCTVWSGPYHMFHHTQTLCSF